MTIPAHVQNKDVHAAQTVLDALQQAAAETSTLEEYSLQARGILAAWCADVREAGYLQGVQVGRQLIANVVRDALEGEGVAWRPSDVLELDR